MNELVDLFRRHYRLGSTTYLLLLDLFFLSFFAYDWVRYDRMGLSVLAVPRWYFLGPEQDLGNVVFFLFTLVVLAPLVIAFLRITGIVSFTSKPGRVIWPKVVLPLHLFISCVVAWACLLAHNMEVVSGYVLSGDPNQADVATLFHSYFHSIVNSPLFGMWPKLFSAVALIVGPILAHYAFQGDDLPRWLKQYVIRARLADLPSTMRPPIHTNRYFLNEGLPAPEVPAAVIVADEALRKYRSPGLNNGKVSDYADKDMVDWKRDAFRLLTSPGADNLDLEIEIFTEYFRALEAALARIENQKLIVACPYASPSLVRFLTWHASLTGNTFSPVRFEQSDYFLDWGMQESKILDEVRRLGSSNSGTIAFVLSEVCYATGRRVPLHSFLERLKTIVPNVRMRVIVDGRNAVGNRALLTIDPGWDFYVFNPHRWLLARESCGVLLSKARVNDRAMAVGSWQFGWNKSDAQLRVLAGLRGSLALLVDPGFVELSSRCEDLRTELRLSLPDRMQIVGDGSGAEETFILTCCPIPDSAWRFSSPQDLDTALVARSLPASLLTLNPRNPWVRITLPYYMDLRELNRLCGFLGEATR